MFFNKTLFEDFIFDQQTIPLILDLEYPEIITEPQVLEFGFVTDGDTRKSYVSISHTSSVAFDFFDDLMF